MTYFANKKKATPPIGHGSRVVVKRHNTTQGATRFSVSRSLKPYLLTEGQSVQYGRTGLSAHTYYIYIQLSSFA